MLFNCDAKTQIIVPALHLSSQLLVWQLHNLESASAAAAVDRAAGAEVKDEEGGSEALLTPQIRNEIRLLSQRIRELVELLTQILRFEFKDVMYEVRASIVEYIYEYVHCTEYSTMYSRPHAFINKFGTVI